ncbi:MAG: hypothetical protein J6L76_04105 [Clostridia bacterium]|nr:hypothetical protein [Clostridia bacterium]
MIRKFTVCFLCVAMLFSFAACTTEVASPAETTAADETHQPSDVSHPVFKTENVVRITFYAYYGAGKGSDVSAKDMPEILRWLDSFTVSPETADQYPPPGTNTYHVEIEYADGQIVQEGLDMITIDGKGYLLEKDPTPDCFEEIISKTSLSPFSSWKTAYSDYLEAKKEAYLSYALVYMDNDDVPELYLSGNCEAVGDSICTFRNGTVVEQPLNRIGGGWYIKKSGEIFNRNGHMGHISIHVYELTDKGFTLTFNAESIDNDLTCTYFIGEEAVGKSAFDAAVEAAFDSEQAKPLHEGAVDYDEIQAQITAFP